MIKKKKLLKYNMFGKTLPTDHSYSWCIINDGEDDVYMIEVQKKLFSMGLTWNGRSVNSVKRRHNMKTISFGYSPGDIGFRFGGDDKEPWAERQIKASEFLKW